MVNLVFVCWNSYINFGFFKGRHHFSKLCYSICKLGFYIDIDNITNLFLQKEYQKSIFNAIFITNQTLVCAVLCTYEILCRKSIRIGQIMVYGKYGITVEYTVSQLIVNS